MPCWDRLRYGEFVRVGDCRFAIVVRRSGSSRRRRRGPVDCRGGGDAQEVGKARSGGRHRLRAVALAPLEVTIIEAVAARGSRRAPTRCRPSVAFGPPSRVRARRRGRPDDAVDDDDDPRRAGRTSKRRRCASPIPPRTVGRWTSLGRCRARRRGRQRSPRRRQSTSREPDQSPLPPE
jgi:hypothetical protein